ncbi:hypothetical protein GALMADRAFT_123707 [Galerina marginata CBS 339.88]|uniref:Uncharacterized protein n=1 Tax=Galerina marginata (strain CBS 339.88) TaxID=685588 RepID=A0A067SW13_GALM3|nr:hypothetical protein GALMADRAFT_123707 [Galerina marginata CBS 339.88]
MCYKEHLTRAYGCGATTGRMNVPGANFFQAASTTDEITCDIRERTYGAYEVYCRQCAQNRQPRLEFGAWTVQTGVMLCYQPSVYTATWRTTRHCISKGVNGTSSCQRQGTWHPYPRAPGVFQGERPVLPLHP